MRRAASQPCAMAVAQEQEMKARVQEMRAKLVEAEAMVPMAMAEALRAGRLGGNALRCGGENATSDDGGHWFLPVVSC